MNYSAMVIRQQEQPALFVMLERQRELVERLQADSRVIPSPENTEALKNAIEGLQGLYKILEGD